MFVFTLLQIAVQMVGLIVKGIFFAGQYAFHCCMGLLLASALPHTDYAALAFAVGIVGAIGASMLLSHYPKLYRQIVYGSVGVITGSVITVQSQGNSNALALITLALTGLCLWQACRGD